jgi:hypothetical protein
MMEPVMGASLLRVGDFWGLRPLGVTAGERSEEMLRAPELVPGGAEGSSGKHLLPYRDDLLAEQDPEEAYQRDDWRRR